MKKYIMALSILMCNTCFIYAQHAHWDELQKTESTTETEIRKYPSFFYSPSSVIKHSDHSDWYIVSLLMNQADYVKSSLGPYKSIKMQAIVDCTNKQISPTGKIVGYSEKFAQGEVTGEMDCRRGFNSVNPGFETELYQKVCN